MLNMASSETTYGSPSTLCEATLFVLAFPGVIVRRSALGNIVDRDISAGNLTIFHLLRGGVVFCGLCDYLAKMICNGRMVDDLSCMR